MNKKEKNSEWLFCVGQCRSDNVKKISRVEVIKKGSFIDLYVVAMAWADDESEFCPFLIPEQTYLMTRNQPVTKMSPNRINSVENIDCMEEKNE